MRVILAHFLALVLLFALQRLGALLVMRPVVEGRASGHTASLLYLIFPVVGGLMMGAEYALLLRQKALFHAAGFLTVWIIVLAILGRAYAARESGFSAIDLVPPALVQCLATIATVLVVIRMR